MLEPYEWKRSRTVLRRERASNRPDLADYQDSVETLEKWKKTEASEAPAETVTPTNNKTADEGVLASVPSVQEGA